MLSQESTGKGKIEIDGMPSRGDLVACLADLDEVAPPIEPLRLLGTGVFNWVFETGSGFIVRVGRTAEAARRHETESRVLRWLAGKTSAPIPSPAALLPPGCGLCSGALIYRKLGGRIMQRSDAFAPDGSRLAGDLGKFWAELHRIPLSQARELGLASYHYSLGRNGPSAALLSVQARANRALSRRLRPPEMAAIERWWEAFFEAPSLQETPEVVCHGDLWPGNLLVGEDDRLCGVLDWELVSIGDPSVDLGKRVDFSAPFWDRFLESYEAHGGSIDEATRARMRRWSEFRAFEALICHLDDETMLDADVASLRAASFFEPVNAAPLTPPPLPRRRRAR